jgi:hypothetical protein
MAQDERGREAEAFDYTGNVGGEVVEREAFHRAGAAACAARVDADSAESSIGQSVGQIGQVADRQAATG